MTYAIWMMDMVAKGTKGNGASQQSPLNVIETFVENANQREKSLLTQLLFVFAQFLEVVV